jgi:hypothetical protein
VEVRAANLVTDELPGREFDVVHSRLVLEHIPEHEQVLARLVECARSGGAVVMEDLDWTAFGIDATNDDDSGQRVTEGILAFMGAAGFDRVFGRKLVGAMVNAGLVDVRAEGRSFIIESDHPGYSFFYLSFQQIVPMAIDAGLVQQADADVVEAQFAEGSARIITPTLVAAVGRRP